MLLHAKSSCIDSYPDDDHDPYRIDWMTPSAISAGTVASAATTPRRQRRSDRSASTHAIQTRPASGMRFGRIRIAIPEARPAPAARPIVGEVARESASSQAAVAGTSLIGWVS